MSKFDNFRGGNDADLDKSEQNQQLSRIANIEAGTDGIFSDQMTFVANLEAGTDEFLAGHEAEKTRKAFSDGLEAGTDAFGGFSQESGVTENAPYQNMAKYKMIPDADESDSIQNSQGS